MLALEFTSALSRLGFEFYRHADTLEACLPLGDPWTCTEYVSVSAVCDDDDGTVSDIQVCKSYADPNGSSCVTEVVDTCDTIAALKAAIQTII